MAQKNVDTKTRRRGGGRFQLWLFILLILSSLASWIVGRRPGSERETTDESPAKPIAAAEGGAEAGAVAGRPAAVDARDATDQARVARSRTWSPRAGDLRPEGRGHVFGRVVDVEGKPAAGARVVLRALYDRSNFPGMAEEPVLADAATDEDGRFLLSSTAPHGLGVVVTASVDRPEPAIAVSKPTELLARTAVDVGLVVLPRPRGRPNELRLAAPERYATASVAVRIAPPPTVFGATPLLIDEHGRIVASAGDPLFEGRFAAGAAQLPTLGPGLEVCVQANGALPRRLDATAASDAPIVLEAIESDTLAIDIEGPTIVVGPGDRPLGRSATGRGELLLPFRASPSDSKLLATGSIPVLLEALRTNPPPALAARGKIGVAAHQLETPLIRPTGGAVRAHDFAFMLECLGADIGAPNADRTTYSLPEGQYVVSTAKETVHVARGAVVMLADLAPAALGTALFLVRDARTKEPLAGVTIARLEQRPEYLADHLLPRDAVTDRSGKAVFAGREPRDSRFHFSAPRHLSKSIERQRSAPDPGERPASSPLAGDSVEIIELEPGPELIVRVPDAAARFVGLGAAAIDRSGRTLTARFDATGRAAFGNVAPGRWALIVSGDHVAIPADSWSWLSAPDNARLVTVVGGSRTSEVDWPLPRPVERDIAVALEGTLDSQPVRVEIVIADSADEGPTRPPAPGVWPTVVVDDARAAGPVRRVFWPGRYVAAATHGALSRVQYFEVDGASEGTVRLAFDFEKR